MDAEKSTDGEIDVSAVFVLTILNIWFFFVFIFADGKQLYSTPLCPLCT